MNSSSTQQQQETAWLAARLRDLRLDAERFQEKAYAIDLSAVGFDLGHVVDHITDALVKLKAMEGRTDA